MDGFSIGIGPIRWSEVAINGSFLFALIVIWLHHARRDLPPRTESLSQYAAGSTYLAMTAAFAALAVATAGVAFELGFASPKTPMGLASVVLLWLAAIGIGVVAAVLVPDPDDRRTRPPVHTAATLVFFVAAAAGAMMAAAGQTTVTRTIAWGLAGGVTLLLASERRAPLLFEIRGWLQRACFALFVSWLVLVGQTLVGETILRRAAM